MPVALSTELDVLFLIGCWEGESKRYRVYNIIEGLNLAGLRCEAIDFSDCHRVVDENVQPRTVIFFRAPHDDTRRVTEVLEYCRAKGITTVFDIDDYLFEPQVTGFIPGVSQMTAEQRKGFDRGITAYRKLLLACDCATVTTGWLRDRVAEIGQKCHVVPNSINAAQIELADRLLAQRTRVHGAIRIGYFSGTGTHQRDFRVCEAALKALLRRYPRAMFRLVGVFDLDESWDAFSSQVERIGLLEPLEMLASLAECDINLAPLEEENPFCEGKSELKWFESALVAVPTVSSRTAPFKAAIRDGENGFLASTPEEWEWKLEQLIRSVALRESLGGTARLTVLRDFSQDHAAKLAIAAYGLDKARPTVRAIAPPVAAADMRPFAQSPVTVATAPIPAPGRTEGNEVSGRKLKIGWILPGLVIGGGGHRNILRAAYHLERFGHDVRLYFTNSELSNAELVNAVQTHFYPFGGPISCFAGHAAGEDVMMATHWSTVGAVESVRADIGQIMYFVQDFEPAFYALGSDYILAENTYRKNYYAITSGPWCAHILNRDYAMEADSFRFPVDREIYHADATQSAPRDKRILFFAKPEMPRRCFEIGAMALGHFHRMRPDYEIMYFGSAKAREFRQSYPVRYLDVVPTLDDLARLYATSQVGLAFSTTNPSLVPYEMMACGLPVLDLARPGNEVNYDNREDIAFMADAQPEIMAEQLAELVNDAPQLTMRSRNGLEFAANFPTEEEMAKRVEHLIMARMAKVGA